MDFVLENKAVFQAFRSQYPEFIYREYSWKREGAALVLSFVYELAPRDVVTTSITLRLPAGVSDETIAAHESYMFRIGLVEALSYWKARCSPIVRVVCGGALGEAERAWWLDTWYDGMGEFRYRNGLLCVKKEDWVDFVFEGVRAGKTLSSDQPKLSGNLIAFTGGKDSTLALGLLHDSGLGPNETFFLQALALNRTEIKSALGADYPETLIERSMHPRLIELNKSGALNGHTPFSVVVAFLGMLTASLRNLKYVIVANEESANQPTVPGTGINHQYSKSLAFEKRFQEYAKLIWPNGPEYFSILRPLSEIGIAAMLKKYERVMPYVSSCNTKEKSGPWCAHCAKCLFAFLLFAAAWDIAFATRTLGQNMLDHEEFREILHELTGLAETRPFECVGTTQESLAILSRLFSVQPESRGTALLKEFWEKRQDTLMNPNVFHALACEFHEHAMPDELFVELLEKAQNEICYG